MGQEIVEIHRLNGLAITNQSDLTVTALVGRSTRLVQGMHHCGHRRQLVSAWSFCAQDGHLNASDFCQGQFKVGLAAVE